MTDPNKFRQILTVLHEVLTDTMPVSERAEQNDMSRWTVWRLKGQILAKMAETFAARARLVAHTEAFFSGVPQAGSPEPGAEFREAVRLTARLLANVRELYDLAERLVPSADEVG